METKANGNLKGYHSDGGNFCKLGNLLRDAQAHAAKTPEGKAADLVANQVVAKLQPKAGKKAACNCASLTCQVHRHRVVWPNPLRANCCTKATSLEKER